MTLRIRYYSKLWYGLIACLASLAGTLLLPNEQARPSAVALLIGAAVLTVIIWGQQKWISAFPCHPVTPSASSGRDRSFYLFGIVGALLVALAGDLRYIAAPKETFGLAGVLWLASIGLLLCSVFFGSQATDRANEEHPTPWMTWEIVILAGLLLLALLTRIWPLTSFPDNIYPDEIMTGTVATQSYITQTGSGPSVFSTVWSGIDLPALWFWIVSLSLKLGGSTLATLRLPAALFGAATVLPLYGLIRGTWGRYAAMQERPSWLSAPVISITAASHLIT
jgi:hypothetical protein